MAELSSLWVSGCSSLASFALRRSMNYTNFSREVGLMSCALVVLCRTVLFGWASGRLGRCDLWMKIFGCCVESESESADEVEECRP